VVGTTAADIVIRPRTPADDDAVARVIDAAFGGGAESRLVAALRQTGAAAIDLVAVEDAIVGHVLFSVLEVTLDGRPVKSLALAPVAVRPDRQAAGIGGALIRRGLERAHADGWQAVFVLGDPGYYRRFGFTPAPRHLAAIYSGAAFQALALQSGALDGAAGRVTYPPAFGLVG
jgi:putative acetyltransferase